MENEEKQVQEVPLHKDEPLQFNFSGGKMRSSITIPAEDCYKLAGALASFLREKGIACEVVEYETGVDPVKP